MQEIYYKILYRTSVIARVIFPKQSPLARRDCFVGKTALLAMKKFSRICTVENYKSHFDLSFFSNSITANTTIPPVIAMDRSHRLSDVTPKNSASDGT